jgi:hypothetical protein
MTILSDTESRIRRLAKSELSMTSRLGYVALLLVAGAMTVIIVSMWATEPGLPGRARFAFAVMTGIGISWIGLATWALTTRRVLAAQDRVIAGWMAVTFTSVFVVGAGLVAFLARNAAGLQALGMGLLMLALAVRALWKARRRRSELLARREELERELEGAAS